VKFHYNKNMVNQDQSMESKMEMENVIRIDVKKINEKKYSEIFLNSPIQLSFDISWEDAEEALKQFIPEGYELVGYHGPAKKGR
jgi:hypothetical protein